jgi:hypothetical protein
LASELRFTQVQIPVQSEREFTILRAALDRIFAPVEVEAFLSRVRSKGLRVRDFDGVLAKRVLEDSDRELRSAKTSAQQLYDALPVSDQAQIREHYLLRIEQVDDAVRTKFSKLYIDL